MTIPWWVVGLIGFVTTTLILIFVGRFPAYYHRFKYVREARKHNERARLLRLEKTEYFGYPLPVGKQGTLRITYDMIVHNPHRFSNSVLQKVYEDRARDLWVDMEYERDAMTRDLVISWKPCRKRRPKEVY